MIAFGLGYPIFVIVCMHVLWHEYYCLWPGLPHLCDCMAVRRMARVSLLLGLRYVIFVIVWLYVVWREYYCLWPGLPHLCNCIGVRCVARELLPLAWVTSSL